MKKLATTLLLTTLMSTAAFAQQDEFYIKITGGASFLSDVTTKNFTHTELTIPVDQTKTLFSTAVFNVGGGLGYYLADKIRVELTGHGVFTPQYKLEDKSVKNVAFASSATQPLLLDTTGQALVGTDPALPDLAAAFFNSPEAKNTVKYDITDMSLVSGFVAGYFDIIDTDMAKVFVGGGAGITAISSKVTSDITLNTTAQTAVTNFDGTTVSTGVNRTPAQKVGLNSVRDYKGFSYNFGFKFGGGISVPISENAAIDLGYEYVNYGKGIGKTEATNGVAAVEGTLSSAISAQEGKVAVRFCF